MIQLTPPQHAAIRPLFSNFGQRLHGLVEAAFSGDFGTAWADDPEAPTVALAHIDFWLVGGDAGKPAAADALRLVPKGTIVTDGTMAWDGLVRTTLAERITECQRTAMRSPAPEDWDRSRLKGLAESLAVGFEIRRITGRNLDAFVEVASDFVQHYRSSEIFLARGIGFGVFEGRHCVAGCSSYTLANGRLEIEIDTRPGIGDAALRARSPPPSLSTASSAGSSRAGMRTTRSRPRWPRSWASWIPLRT